MDEIIKVDSNSELMKNIASGNYTNDDVSYLTEKDKSINQMKLFLLAQAKRELSRVIKLTEFLDKIESRYEKRVMEDIDILPLKDFPTVIATITACLTRSNNIIQKVLNDDSLTQLVFIDNSTNKTIGAIGAANQLNLDSPDSRDRVNKVVRNMLNVIDKNMEIAEEGGNIE